MVELKLETKTRPPGVPIDQIYVEVKVPTYSAAPFTATLLIRIALVDETRRDDHEQSLPVIPDERDA